MPHIQLDDPAAPSVINALLLDDSAFDRKRIRRLSDTTGLPIMMEEAPTLDDMARSMNRKSYDLMLIDYRLSEGDGLSALQMAQAHAQNCTAAKIMISGNADIDIAVSALKMGCQDYLCKQDISAAALRTSITQALAKHRPNPLPDLQEIAERALLDAMRSDAFIAQVQPALLAGLRGAAKDLRKDARAPASPQLQKFMKDFSSGDDFAFEYGTDTSAKPKN